MKDLRVSLLLKIKFVAMALLIIIGFSFNISSDSNSSRALNEVRKQYDTGLKEVNANISTLVSLSKSFDKSDEMLVELQTQVRKTRLSYKKIEYLVAYFDSYNTKKNINGAPLPSLEPNVPEITVLQPKGLQVLDEMVFSEEFDKQSEDFVVLALALQSDFEQVLSYQQKIKIEHRHVFESMRQELVRIFTLGVTGFDTPGSANGVEEAKYAFKGVYDALNSYMPLIVEKNKGLAILMDARMKHTIDYLETNHDFETFDRLAFLKEHIDPQYQILYTLHRQLGIEFYEETSTLPKAVNYEASSIFSKDFLNPSYFANQKIDEPNKVKRQALGRLLFFDPILSNNNERACASCHNPEKAFTDGLKKSEAFDHSGFLDRNSPTLVNAVFADRYFWDLREKRLDKQMLHVVNSEKEFNSHYLEIIEKIKGSSEYVSLFNVAYPDQKEYSLSTYSISDALSVYIASLTDFDSDFDKYVRGEVHTIDPAVRNGFNNFMGKAACGTCHFAPAFNGSVPPTYTESESEVLGIPFVKDTVNLILDNDLGRYGSKLAGEEADFYKNSFKTVTVRNTKLTAPYMHNGVFDTLEEVVDFYNRGGGANMGLDLPHQTLPFDNLSLTPVEQRELVAFMNALTGDMSKFSEPDSLPSFDLNTNLNERMIGGEY